MMAEIRIQNLSFYYEGSYDDIFREVSLHLDTDWKLGLVGRNGRGKSTLLHLLMNKYEYSGKIFSPVRFDYFPKEVPFPERAVRDVASALYPEYQEWKLLRELSLMEMDPALLGRAFDTLSPGERTRILIALMFSFDEQFPLIDEPTNHLDFQAREMVQAYLQKKKGFILVSHDRSFLDACIDHVLAINKTTIEVSRGNFSVWWSNKENRDKFETAENKKLSKEIADLQEAQRRARGWSDQVEKSKFGGKAPDRGYIGAKSAKMMKRAKSIERRKEAAAKQKQTLLKDIESVEALKIHPLTHAKETLLHLENLSLFYGEKKVCGELSFDIRNGDRVILRGKNGSGKSTLIRKILGEEIRSSGKLEKAPGLLISYISQDTSHLRGSLKDHCRRRGIDESLFKTILRKLDFQRLQFEKEIQDYSEGQRKKVLIASSLCEKAHLYIWDEPLNYIDIFSRIQLETLLQSYAPTLLLVEHDKLFTETLGTVFIDL